VSAVVVGNASIIWACEDRFGSKAVFVARPCDVRSASERRHRSADEGGDGAGLLAREGSLIDGDILMGA
jgi:hypothetical protein